MQISKDAVRARREENPRSSPVEAKAVLESPGIREIETIAGQKIEGPARYSLGTPKMVNFLVFSAFYQ